MKRRKFLLGSVAAAALAVPAAPAKAAHAGKTVGAIRWDPWYSVADSGARANMEASLGPSKWQGRAPACTTVVNSYTVNFGTCNTQAQIDSEITAAHNAGLDYWAYVWYGSSDPLMQAWTLHQSSTIKNNMNWCMIFSSYAKFVSEIASYQSSYITWFQQTNYQKVLTNRPLIYLLSDSTAVATLAATITTLRAACVSAGMGTPYIVLLVSASAGAVAAAGADAIGFYAHGSDGQQTPYATLVTNTEAYWNTMVATGQATVPTAMTGHDRRPRIERPVPWEVTTQTPYVGDSLYVVAGTASAIAAHVGDMLTWLTANSANSPAQTGLIYSWDEHDEGGSTLNPSIGTGSAILSAIGSVL